MTKLGKINLRNVSDLLSENEMKSVTGGYEYGYGYGEEAGVTVKPCGSPKRPCSGPHGAIVYTTEGQGVCCLGPWGPNGWLGTFCYAVLIGLYRCP